LNLDKVTAETVRILFIGDSITYGFPYGPDHSWVRIVEKETGLATVNKGVNGDSLPDMKRRFNNILSKERVTHVHILGGTNDAWLGLDLDKSLNAVDHIVKECLKRQIRPVLGMTIPVCENPKGGGTFIPYGLKQLEGWLVHFRSLLRQYCTVNSILSIDYYNQLVLRDTGKGNPLFFLDECHLSTDGNMAMARAASAGFAEFI